MGHYTVTKNDIEREWSEFTEYYNFDMEFQRMPDSDNDYDGF
jgi:hypothetical protein